MELGGLVMSWVWEVGPHLLSLHQPGEAWGDGVLVTVAWWSGVGPKGPLGPPRRGEESGHWRDPASRSRLGVIKIGSSLKLSKVSVITWGRGGCFRSIQEIPLLKQLCI